MPDSPTLRCQAGTCPATMEGEDGDYQTAVSTFCSDADVQSADGGNGFPTLDTTTGLGWLLPFSGVGPVKASSVSQASDVCTSFGYLVPTTIELLSLLDMGPTAGPLTTYPLNGPTTTELMQASPYWTVTSFVDGGGPLVVDFATGGYAPVPPHASVVYDVICVNPPSAATPTWTILSPTQLPAGATEEFVYFPTGLEWLVLDTGPYDWSESLSACNNLPADETDMCASWRAPTYKELATLVNMTGADAGPPVAPAMAWTSTADEAPSSTSAGYDEVYFPDAGGGLLQPLFGVDLTTAGSTTVLCVHNLP